MISQRKKRRLSRKRQRSAVAAVECAIVLPLLTLLVLGAIDAGQFANVYQKVSDASREGARAAARYGTETTSQVKATVMSYLAEVSNGNSLAAAAQVTITDSSGNPIPGGDLTKAVSGSQIQVRVSLMYDPVRWIDGVKGLDGRQIATTTMMRRE